jgi:hypothetical protein
VGRVGKPVAAYSDAVVSSVREAAERHPDAVAREVASRSLREIIGSGNE